MVSHPDGGIARHRRAAVRVTAVERADDRQRLEWEVEETRTGSVGFLKVESRSYRMPDGQVAI